MKHENSTYLCLHPSRERDNERKNERARERKRASERAWEGEREKERESEREEGMETERPRAFHLFRKNLDNQAKNMKTQRSKSALKISLRRNVGVERRRKHDQSLSGGARRKLGTASFWWGHQPTFCVCAKARV